MSLRMSEYGGTSSGGIIGCPFLTELVRNAPIPMAVLEGPDLRFLLVNPAYLAIEARTEGFFLGRPIAEVFPQPELRGAVDAVRKAYETGEQIRQKEQECFVRPSGRRTWWSIANVPLHNAAGQIQAVLTIPEDVTEQVLVRRRIEEQAATLRISEERFKLALEAAGAGTWEWDTATGVVIGSDRALAMHGLPPGIELSIEERIAAIHPEDREAVQAALERSASQGTPYAIEFRSLWPDGSVHWLASKGRLCGTRLLGLIQDITERKQAEEWLSQLATVVKGSSDFIGIAGLDQRALYVNPAGQAMVGLEGDEAARATKIEDYLFPEDLPFARETVLPTVLREGRWKGEFRFQHFQTGEPIVVDWDVFRVDDPRTGQPVKLATVTRDIRPHKAAAQALRESDEMLRLAEQAGDIGSFEWNVKTDDLRVSAGFLVVYEMEPGSFTGGVRSWFERVHPDDVAMMEARISEVSSAYVPQTYAEFRIVRPSGQIRWIEARFRITYDSDGTLTRIVGINVDITERKAAEEMVRKSEELLRLAEQAGNVGSFEWCVQTGRLRLSAGCQAIYGFAPEAYDGTYEAWTSQLSPDGLRWLETQIGEAFARHEVQYKDEFRVVLANGQERWLEGRIRIDYDAEGKPLRVCGVKVDVTERKQIEEALRESEATLRGFFDANAVYMSVLELDGDDIVYTVSNPRIAAFFGQPINEFAGKHGRELGLPEEFIARWRALIRQCQETQRPISREYSVPYRGNQGWYHGTLSPLPPGASGRPRCALAAVDITDRKRTEDALRESEKLFRLATEATSGVVYDWNRLTGLTWRSANLFDVVGYYPDEVSAENDWWRSLIHPDDLATLDPTAIGPHIPLRTLEYRVRHKNGHYVWVWDTARIVRNEDGEAVRVVGCTVSIDARKRAEEALRKSEERLKALNDTLEQRVIERTAIAEQRAAQLRVLAAELSQAEEQERRRLAKVLHDHLQQLLVAARMKVALLRRRTDEERLTRTLEQIDEVLNQAITESRSLTVELSPPVLYDAGLAAGLEWLARQMEEKHGLRVIVDADPEAEPTDEGTRVFLFQAVRELLLNVVKHAQTDVAHVELLPLDGNRLQLVVADPGVGFDFSGLENRGMSGGFGLFSIRERLELLGGRLAVETGPQQGTRMTIEVSRGRLSVTPHVISTELNAVETKERGRTERLARRERTRVVLADDHAIVRQGLAGLLRDQGTIEVVGEAADGRQAVEITLATHPDVVLMDVTMPGLNGIEATRRILSSLPEVRVIGLSMHEEADMATAMRKAGAVAYLRKDTDTDVLMSAIQAEPLSPYEVST